MNKARARAREREQRGKAKKNNQNTLHPNIIHFLHKDYNGYVSDAGIRGARGGGRGIILKLVLLFIFVISESNQSGKTQNNKSQVKIRRECV